MRALAPVKNGRVVPKLGAASAIAAATGTAGKKCYVTVGGTGAAGRFGTIYAGVAQTYVLYIQGGATAGTQVTFLPETDYDGEIESVSAVAENVNQYVEAYSSSGARDNTKMILHTKDFIFDEPNVSKYVKSLLITYRSKVGITVYIYVDGVLSGQKSLPVNNALRNRKISINRECQSISFKLESDDSGGTDEDFIIEDMTIEGWYNDKK